MASIGIHNIKETSVNVKHFDDFSVIHIELNTQSEYEDNPTYEKMDFYFNTPEQLNSFIYAISMASNQLKEAV